MNASEVLKAVLAADLTHLEMCEVLGRLVILAPDALIEAVNNTKESRKP